MKFIFLYCVLKAGMCTCVHIWAHGRVYYCQSPSVWVAVCIKAACE